MPSEYFPNLAKDRCHFSTSCIVKMLEILFQFCKETVRTYPLSADLCKGGPDFFFALYPSNLLFCCILSNALRIFSLLENKVLVNFKAPHCISAGNLQLSS